MKHHNAAVYKIMNTMNSGLRPKECQIYKLDD